MSISLADALRDVDLRPGVVYQCHVGRFRVEVRVEETVPPLLPVALEATDIMLDPWTDLPGPRAATVCQSTPGAPILPDLPNLPLDIEW